MPTLLTPAPAQGVDGAQDDLVVLGGVRRPVGVASMSSHHVTRGFTPWACAYWKA